MAICSVNPVECHVTADHFAHAWSGIFVFFCCKLFLQCIHMNSFITYMSSCSILSAMNCGHVFVVISSFAEDMCLCNFITYQCDKHSFAISSLISQSVAWNSHTVLWNNIWWQHAHTYLGLWFSASRKFASATAFDTFHNRVKLGFHYLLLLIFYHMMHIYIALHFQNLIHVLSIVIQKKHVKS